MSSFPPGFTPTPEYLAQSRAPEIIFGSVFPAAFATIFVIGRFYSRAIIMKNWGWDDTWVLISWLGGSIVLTVLNCYLTKLGAGKHNILVTLADAAPLVRLGLVCRLIYQIVICTVKLGMCAFYLRIFTDKMSKIFIWGMVAFNISYTLPLFLALIFRCEPIASNWSLIPGKCRPDVPPLYASTILNIAGDAGLIAFAIPKILRLQIAPRQKASLAAIMSLSVLVIIAAIVRAVRVRQTADSHDVSYDSYDVTIWTSVELNTSIFCAAAPAVKPLLKKIAPGLISSVTGSRSTTNRISNYAHGTKLSRKAHQSNGFELSSQTNLESKAEQGEYWTDVKGHQTSTSDGASDTETWSRESPGSKREIRKTVKVTVSSGEEQEIGPRVVNKFEAI